MFWGFVFLIFQILLLVLLMNSQTGILQCLVDQLTLSKEYFITFRCKILFTPTYNCTNSIAPYPGNLIHMNLEFFQNRDEENERLRS